MVYFDAKHGRKSGEYISHNILYLNHLLIVIFPPMMFLATRNESLHDLAISFLKYFSFVYERLLIWRNAIRYRRFIV